MEIIVQVPGKMEPKQLEKGLSRVGEKLNVDIHIA
jgi:hypothetical protein